MSTVPINVNPSVFRLFYPYCQLYSGRSIITVETRDGCKVRLTKERWNHIVENHDYMENEREKVIETVSSPDCIVRGHDKELLALKHYPETSIGDKHCVVVYKKEEGEGFIITAFLTSKGDKLIEGREPWRK